MPALISATGVELTRHTAYKFRLDPTPAQAGQFDRYAGASRAAFNQCLEHVDTNYQVRRGERDAGTPAEQGTEAVSRSQFSLINYINAYKNGTSPDSPETARTAIRSRSRPRQMGSGRLTWRKCLSCR